MKRYILIAALLLSLAGCEKPTIGFRAGYIGCYMYFNPDKATITYNNGDFSIWLAPTKSFRDIYVNSNQFVFESNPSLEEQYYALCEKFGDINDNGVICYSTYTWPKPFACFEIVNAISITSDSDWNADHPTGTSLNDLFEITYYTYYPYVSNKYTGEKLVEITKPLTELQHDEMKLIHLDMYLMCPSLPTESQRHTLTISFELDTDRTATYDVEVDFKAAEAA